MEMTSPVSSFRLEVIRPSVILGVNEHSERTLV